MIFDDIAITRTDRSTCKGSGNSWTNETKSIYKTSGLEVRMKREQFIERIVVLLVLLLILSRYIKQCALSENSSFPSMEIIGNGDVFDYSVG